jgi:hypothetical protein
MRTLIKRATIAAFNHGLISDTATAAVFRIFRLREH